ncbi:MAG: GMC family oxidoreductase [Bacteroidetes bacterium]|nr:MAG: GMC family oxidoreductase [Bacteroidota bacterium]
MQKRRKYDAIVIGSGITGGWAAKELCEKGLRTLVLERGRNVRHVLDYPTAMLHPWDFDHRLQKTEQDRENNPVQSACYLYNESTKHFFVQDKEHPYQQVKPFEWIRGYQVGGKSLLWARQTYRWAPFDFESNAKDGHGTDWPIRYDDLAPWYSHVERFAGISGNRDGLEQIPDGEFLPPMELNAGEKHLKQQIEAKWPRRHLVIGRSANLTVPHNGRGPCQYRNLCARGCPYSAYFSSNSSTLPAAVRTKKMTLRPDSIVHSIIYDEKKNRARGVRVIDAQTREMTEYYAKVIFLNAGTLNSTLILLNSTSSRFPDGLGNDSGVLGHYLMDHNYRSRMGGRFEGLADRYYKGRRPNGIYIPRFRNIWDRHPDFVRGYAFGGGAWREDWMRGFGQDDFGTAFKDSLSRPGSWGMGFHGMGECLPRYENHVRINRDILDPWGMPTLDIDCAWGPNEEAMVKDMHQTGYEMLEAAGCKDIVVQDTLEPPGRGIHEMGTARMGRDPDTSVLNGWCQVHTVPNVFVTDGSAMASGACQNPSLTYMALTARACDYAVKELKKKNI